MLPNTSQRHDAHFPQAPDLIQWRKSTYSGYNGNCVEVARFGASVAVRDSKDPSGGVLTFPADVWAAFVEERKAARDAGPQVRQP